MKKFISVILFLLVYIAKANTPIEINLIIKNDLNKTMPYNFSFGIDKNATDNIDKELGELLLPPAPPVAFYAAFEFIDSSQFEPDGSKYYDRIWTNKDMRKYPDIEGLHYVQHKLIFRFGTGKKILINWNKFNIPAEIDSIFLRDALNGIVINVDMKKVDMMEWDNDGITSLFLHVYYNIKTVSVSDEIKSKINLFPNPASDYFNINSTENYDNIQIFDLSGMLLKTVNYKDKIDISELPIGMYLVKLTSNSGILYKKLIRN